MSRRRARARGVNRRWVVGAVITVVIVVGVLIVVGTTMATSSSAKAPSAITPSAMDECGGPACGQANAPVTIEVYADFQCPYCARADAVLQQLVPKYVDTGKVQIIYRNYTFIGPESEAAAQAALCASDQSKFWEYGDYLFTHQAGENTGAFSNNNLVRIAAQLGLDSTTFKACLDGGKYTARVQQETAQAQQRGVQATPTLFINGQKYEGVLSLDQLTSLIDARLPK